MQTAGMLRGTGVTALVSVYLLTTLFFAFVADNAHGLPLQALPNIPGYIPVYIRLGDQPLQDINPALAEAFHEKEILENTRPEHVDHAFGNSEKNSDNQPSYDDENEQDDGLDSGSRKKDTIYLIGVRQSNGDKLKGENNSPKIALPFEIVKREDENNKDRTKAEVAWIEQPDNSHGLKPIALSKQAVIKLDGLPIVKKLEKLAADVEKKETRANDVYDTMSANYRDEPAHRVESHIGKISVWHPASKQPSSADPSEKTVFKTNTDEDDLIEDSRLPTVEDPKEFRSNKWTSSEPLLRPARDPKESRADEDSTDFMEGEE